MKFDFPDISKQQWLEKITTDLKGNPIENLNWQITDQLTMIPFVSLEDIESTTNLAANGDNNWFVLESIIVKDIQHANKEALMALEGGATALSLEIETVECDFSQLLDNINLEWIFIHINGSKEHAISFIKFLNQSSFDIDKINLAVANAGVLFQQHPTIKTQGILEEKNNSVDEDLSELLVKATKQLLESTSNSSKIWFRINLTDSFYQNICKIRALKILWNTICVGFDIEDTTAFIQASMQSPSEEQDADYAKIQAASQAMAAAIGGANVIYLPPTGSAGSLEFHRRIARNVHHLMQLESFMNRVEDPASGSYYLEQLTDTIAASAWKKFQLKYESL